LLLLAKTMATIEALAGYGTPSARFYVYRFVFVSDERTQGSLDALVSIETPRTVLRLRSRVRPHYANF